MGFIIFLIFIILVVLIKNSFVEKNNLKKEKSEVSKTVENNSTQDIKTDNTKKFNSKKEIFKLTLITFVILSVLGNVFKTLEDGTLKSSNVAIFSILIIFMIVAFFIYMKLKKDNLKLKGEKEKLEQENKNIINWKEELNNKYSGIIDIESEKENLKKEIENLKADIISSKEKSLKLIDYREKLEKEISLLEEDQTLQEFGFYKPKYYYETSEKYKEEIEKVNFRQKEMIKNKTAAICTTQWTIGGSVAEGKKQTNNTLKLMIRAFNGESDSAIAKVKYSNIKVMENRIRKTFETINKLNETNRCYIAVEFLNLKLKELELNYEMAVKVQEEKEEQRRIKEQMREEEKAQREFEKAQREAELEEKRSQLALQKAEEKLKTAHGEQLNKLNAQIEKLKADLLQAQQTKERATSMAQITKSGHVYVISNIGSFGENVYKIGMTRRLEPMDRVRELGDASVPFNFDVHAMIFSDNAPELENILHKEFYNNRVNKINDRREFFKVSIEEIKKVAEKYGVEAEFTMIAQAEQYRQTLALENEEKTLEQKKVEEEKKLQSEKDYIMSI